MVHPILEESGGKRKSAARQYGVQICSLRSLGLVLKSAAGLVIQGSNMLTTLQAAGLLVLSNIFMTFAWYGHLKTMNGRPLLIVILASWGIAFFEYTLQVPANRIGFGVLSLPQLKILQEVITLAVFVPFALLYMKQPLKLDYLWAGICLAGAAYFMFRGGVAHAG